MGKVFLFFVYSFVFLVLGGSALNLYLGYSPFFCFDFVSKEVYLNPFSDWYLLYQAFSYGVWSVDSMENLKVFLAFIFFFPLYFSLWFLVKKVSWSKMLLKPFKFLKRQKISSSEGALVNNHYSRPQALRRTVGFGSVALPEKQEASPTKEEIQKQEMQDLVPDVQTAILTPELLDQVRQLGAANGFELFENVGLDNVVVPVVLATDTKALLMTFLMDKREWIADEEVAEEGMEPTWFSAEGLITSPFYLMKKAAATLKLQEPDSDIVPVVVLADGHILNASSMLDVWHQAQGAVVLLNEGVAEGLSSLSDFLTKQASAG